MVHFSQLRCYVDVFYATLHTFVLAAYECKLCSRFLTWRVKNFHSESVLVREKQTSIGEPGREIL